MRAESNARAGHVIAFARCAVAACVIGLAGCSSEGTTGGAALSASAAASVSAEPYVASARVAERRESWPGEPVTASHASTGIKKVVLRAALKDVKVTRREGDVTITGTPTSFEQRPERKPNDGFIRGGFEFKVFGDTLLIATSGEVAYVHTVVAFDAVSLSLPDGVAFEHEPFILTGNSRADLSPPGKPETR